MLSKKIKEIYKGYIGIYSYDKKDHIFYGKIYGINDLITFQSDTESEIEESFHNSIDNYINFCKEIGKEPEKYEI